MEEVDKTGISTLFFLSKKHPIKKGEIESRMKKGVSLIILYRCRTPLNLLFIYLYHYMVSKKIAS